MLFKHGLSGLINVSGGGGASPFSPYAANSITPEFVGDFANATPFFGFSSSASTFSSMFSFSRASIATYTDSAGDIQEATSGTARENSYYYNGASYVKGGLRLEKTAATNGVLQSESFATTPWVGDNITPTTSAIVSPDGTNFADEFDDGTSFTTRKRVYQQNVSGGTTATNAPWTYSIYFYPDTHRYIRFDMSSYINVIVDLNTTPVVDTETVGANCTLDYTRILNVGGGWYRYICACSVLDSAGGTITGRVNFLSDTKTENYTGTNEKVHFWGAQIEEGRIATSYIPTTTGTVTRAAEVLTAAGADTPANTSAMSIKLSGLINYSDEGTAAQETLLRWQADASNYIILDMDTDGAATGEINANQNAAGTLDTVVAAAEYSPGSNVAFSVASRHTSGAINVAKDGTAATADTTPTALAGLTTTALEIGYDFNGFISEVIVWGADVADAGIGETS